MMQHTGIPYCEARQQIAFPFRQRRADRPACLMISTQKPVSIEKQEGLRFRSSHEAMKHSFVPARNDSTDLSKCGWRMITGRRLLWLWQWPLDTSSITWNHSKPLAPTQNCTEHIQWRGQGGTLPNFKNSRPELASVLYQKFLTSAC